MQSPTLEIRDTCTFELHKARAEAIAEILRVPIMKVTLEIYAPLPSLPTVISYEILPSFVLILEEIAFLKFYEDVQKKRFVFTILHPV